MERIATNMPNDTLRFYLARREEGLADIQAKIGVHTRLRELADDPIAAARAVRYSSYLTRLQRFEQNTLAAKEHYNNVDGYLNEANDIMQKLREIAVKGANGTWTQQDTAMMGVEVNELTKELASVGNAIGPDGNYLFAGDRVHSEPFRVVMGSVAGIGEATPIRVEYRGAGDERAIEISDNRYADLDIAGGKAFWAQDMQVLSDVDASAYQVSADTAIFVDGVEVPLAVGDSAAMVAAKINDSGAPVKAYLDPDTRGLSLQGTDAHQITLADGAGGPAVLRELGLIKMNSQQGAPNWADGARVAGGSLFDVAIGLRDALLRGDKQYVGGQALAGLDAALGNLNARRADMGSRAERVDSAWGRINVEIPNITGSIDRDAGLDVTSAAVDLNMLDLAHKTALQTSARILPQSLLDFLH
jgi:flagellar hook-associated protein 3 FlgL